MSFLELARAAERRLFGCEKREKREASHEREMRNISPGCEESEKSEIRVGRPTYSFPWPDAVEGLGARAVGSFVPCDNCATGTWVRYGPWALCLRCANVGRPDT